MYTALNVKVGDQVTVQADDGQQFDGKVVEFPKLVRVLAATGELCDVRLDQIRAESAGKRPAARFASRFKPRV